MLDGQAVSPILEGLFTGPPNAPRLIGSCCIACGIVTFPRQPSCPRCVSLDVEERLLARRERCGAGRSRASRRSPLRTFRFDPDEFEPYGVGYVELVGEVRVEARLTEADPARLAHWHADGARADPRAGRGAHGRVTFAFRPVDEERRR